MEIEQFSVFLAICVSPSETGLFINFAQFSDAFLALLWFCSVLFGFFFCSFRHSAADNPLAVWDIAHVKHISQLVTCHFPATSVCDDLQT